MGDNNDKRPFWNTLPGILTGIAAVITAIATLLGALHFGLLDNKSETTPTPTITPTSTSALYDCFPEVPINRTRIMEGGTQDFELIGPLESKDEPIVIKFTENNKPIGSIKLFFYSNIQIFKIEKVADPRCQQIEEYSNIDRGGDKHVLQNFDSVQMQFGDNKYILRLGYGDGTISANFVHTV